MTRIDCCECGIEMSLPEHYYDILRKTHRSFFCPNGHKQYFPEKSIEEKLREQIRNQETMITNRDSVISDLRATLNHKRKVRQCKKE